MVIVTRIDIEYFPETNHGKPWDQEEQGDGILPDVFMILKNKNHEYSILPRIQNASGHLIFKHGDLPVYLQHPEDEIMFEILDYDNATSDTLYSGKVTMWQSSGDENKHAVEFKTADLKVLFTVVFDYNR